MNITLQEVSREKVRVLGRYGVNHLRNCEPRDSLLIRLLLRVY